VFLSRYLSPEGVDLFGAMPRYDQQHAMNVLRALQQQGHDEPDLLAAALLHDIGKTVPRRGGVRLWHRVAVVLMRVFWPGLLDQVGRDEAGSWRRPFYVQQHHSAIGAELAQQAGCSPVTVDLIGRHEDLPDQPADLLLAALQAADATN
jgi:putative nucleotidyltransferase with HDIG domain